MKIKDAIFLSFLLLATLSAEAQDKTNSSKKDSTDRPVIFLTGKLHETTFDVMDIDTLDDGDDDPMFTVGGAVRFNYFVKTWEGQSDNQDKFGDMAFDIFRINVSGQHKGIVLNAEYRFYSDAFGGAMPHSAWAGYNFNERDQIQIGLHQVPFGNQTYNSDNWFFNVTYYLGLEDDYDLGVKYSHTGDKLSYILAFYKNSELPPSDAGRYSYDFVGDFEETNQFNAKVVYSLTETTRMGISGQWGGIYNPNVDESNGNHHALALHMRGDYNNVGVKLQATTFGADIPKDQSASSGETLSEDIITMGAYSAPYNVAYEGQVYTASLSYKIKVDWGPISRLVVYDNYSYFDKTNESYEDTQMNVLGTMVQAGPIYTYIDLASGLNHSWLGPNYGDALGKGDPSAEWHTRFNINFGYYF